MGLTTETKLSDIVNQVKTKLTANQPNMQNIPVRTPEGAAILQAFLNHHKVK